MNAASLAQIDPVLAWEPFHPTAESPWDRRRAAHLYRRAGFGASVPELQEAVQAGPEEAVNRLVHGGDEPAEFREDSDLLAHSLLAGGDVGKLGAWWFYRLLHTPQPLREKMTLFWHGHFASSGDKVQDMVMMYEQNRLLRRHALGSFRQLVHDISRDPAMLVYLDSATNRKSHPNENYARELMELFCLGEGNYTEQDVQELARCFTGWEVKQRRFRFNRFQHDTGVKSILQSSGAFDGEAAIEIVLSQASGPRFIARKLFHFFVCDEPAPPPALLEPLAQRFRDSQWQIAPVVEQILRSQLFFSELSVGRKVKSPAELLAGLLRSLEGTTNLHRLAEEAGQLGQALFFPPNVKGWEGGRAWINSSTLLGRSNAVYRLLRDEHTRFGAKSLADYLTRLGWRSGEQVLENLSELLMPLPLPAAVRQTLVEQLEAAPPARRNEKLTEVLHLLCTMPEFQLG